MREEHAPIQNREIASYFYRSFLPRNPQYRWAQSIGNPQRLSRSPADILPIRERPEPELLVKESLGPVGLLPPVCRGLPSRAKIFLNRRNEAGASFALENSFSSMWHGGRLYLSIQTEKAGPTDFDPRPEIARLRRLSDSLGIRTDVRKSVLDRWTDEPSKEPASRIALLEVWEAALEPRPAAIGLSLSHAAGASVAVARISDSGSAAVGVDVERADRPIAPRIRGRISNALDRAEDLQDVALWAAKEATYKADIASPRSLLRDYSIQCEAGQDGALSVFGGGPEMAEFRIILQLKQNYQIAIALAMHIR